MSDSTRKYLWIAAGASAFILIVAAAATLLFAPSPQSDRTPFSFGKDAEPKQERATDFLADAPAAADSAGAQTGGQSGGKSGDIYIVYGDKEVTSTTVVTNPPAPAQPKPQSTTIRVVPPEPATSPATQTAPATKAPSTSVAPVPVAKPAATPAANPAPAAPVATKAPSSLDWWIQAGMFSVKANADALKASFQAKSLQAAITIRDKDGKSYYVVKVGPYPTRAEASKWLSTARSVKGAEQAWITQ
ncbi:MAG TPA: SPOR domain-containing protein [Rectinemataceae bacterium]